jgi:NAD(P)-dependent dehydrogenase (short-subunit alcohol dehydrogenase family)
MDFLNTAEKRDRRMVHLPMGRFGEAIEVARGALFRSSFLSFNHLDLTCVQLRAMTAAT